VISKEERNIQLRERIVQTLKEYGEGISLRELMASLGKGERDLRTLQRRLNSLIKERLVVRTGKTNNVRYHYLQKAEVAGPAISKAPFEIPLSQESKKVLEMVSRPVEARKPVGHNRDFLDSYTPNSTMYLSKPELDRLAAKGHVNLMEHQPAGTYANVILSRLLIDLSWNSSRLEGNTYSLLDTEKLIAAGQVATDKEAKETQMILNHKDAIEYIVKGGDYIRFNSHTLLNLHALLSNNLLSDPAASGRLRRIPVAIQKSVYLPPGIPQLTDELFDVFLDKASQIEDPFEQALFTMVQIPYLQLFEDVNKRVSRIAANIPFVKKNLVPLSFVDVPNDLYISAMLAIYELNDTHLLKDLFLWAYERSTQRYGAIQQSLGEPDRFRLQYRDQIRSAIQDVVNNTLPQEEASKLILLKASMLPEADRTHYLETVEKELLALHEGNIARYRLELPAFLRWRSAWAKPEIN